MNGTAPSTLETPMLARRLGELVGEERNVQVEFLLHLDEFDRRRAYLEAGFGSLWDYCLRALHLREGAAGRRIGAMRVLRRFPRLEAALRDGRLCLSTLALLGPVLTEERADDLVSRAAWRTKAEVDHLVASVRPRAAPRDGIRKVPGTEPRDGGDGASDARSVWGRADGHPIAQRLIAVSLDDAPAAETNPQPMPSPLPAPGTSPVVPAPPVAAPERERCDESTATAPAPQPDPSSEIVRPRTSELRPVSEERWSLRVTIDTATKDELETLQTLLSHKMSDGDLAAVLREAIRCGIEKHGRRKGAVAPAHERKVQSRSDRGPASPPPATRPASPSRPAVLARQVVGSAQRGGKRAADRRAGATTGAESTPPVSGSCRGADAEKRSAAGPRIPSAVRREVWRRDGGTCTWKGSDGRRCGSRWQLEIDHVRPPLLGGTSEPDNLRILCRRHNMLHAEEVYGREHMDRFRRRVIPGLGLPFA